MKLYIYDHCPYCTKARMIFGFKNHSLKIMTLLNDDEKTPVSMVGQKMVPVLEVAPNQFMSESLDIIRYIDEKDTPRISWEQNPSCQEWLSQTSSYLYPLTMPRWVKSSLGEFSTESARKYFQNKKELYIGSFKAAENNSSKLIKECETHLQELEILFKKDFLKNDEWGESHFHLFAVLRALSVVKGLSLPSKVKNYMDSMSQRSGVPLSIPI